MPAGLSHLQKRDIAVAARRAYDRWPEREAFEAINSDQSKTACFDAWRHVETGKAAGGTQSLCECTQAQYARVLAHFQRLAGQESVAQHTEAKDQDNPRRIALWHLDKALRERGLSLEYASKMSRGQYRCTIDEASAGQLWRLIYTIRNRHKATVRPAKIAAPSNDDPF
ncbi:MAG TPA: hypothetical protein VK163_06135 [Opitutaceae bacterium]|nr:hypothetical protein [Opitutaceae bacterium]